MDTLHDQLSRAEDRRLDPPREVEPRMGDCFRCAATGQARPQGMGGAWGECPACGGSGQVEIGPPEEEYEIDG